ncbi:MAG: tetratricopeptide repeat protein [Anaerolineaceae bacterium]|nr:tetratricopeptide repeat protein [Anaerolineaceae bacterium]
MNNYRMLKNTEEYVLTRRKFLLIANEGVAVKAKQFTRQLLKRWLDDFPYDLNVNLLNAKSLLLDGKNSSAIEVLQEILRRDPEYLEAHEIMAQVGQGKAKEESAAAARVLPGMLKDCEIVPEIPWTKVYVDARKLYDAGRSDEAESMLFQVIAMTDNPLPAVLHIRITAANRDATTVKNLSAIYANRWKDALQFKLFLASAKLELDESVEGMSLMRECATKDVSGQVAKRVWGPQHAYAPIWSDSLQINFSFPIPADIATRLGWNHLPAETGTDSNYQAPAKQSVRRMPVNQAVPMQKKGERKLPLQHEEIGHNPAFRSVEDAFAKLSKKLKKPSIQKSDGRFPVYVIFSSWNGLTKKYGNETALMIDQKARQLAELIGKKPEWNAVVYYPDDLNSIKNYEVPQVNGDDPWELKLSLVDLDEALAKKGQRIGALLIVGGPDVVPHHNLPNPTDDSDATVPSDNPYSTLDANYFVPEWPIGRLPGEAGSDAGLLLEQVRRLCQYHEKYKKTAKGLPGLNFDFKFLEFLRNLFQSSVTNKLEKNFGYSASVWRRSSIAAFRPIGEGNALLVSPPAYSGAFDLQRIQQSKMAYFNLHGLIDSAEWYGQKDFSESSSGPDYPVALSPKDLTRSEETPKIIFSEACYGGHIEGKTEDQSLTLRFLSIGTQAVVASSVIAYGSVSSPLIGADLLGYLFWKYIKEGYCIGEAFLKSKFDMVREMNRRQGFLDGEDQKTLLSFILYGDPLMNVDGANKAQRQVDRLRIHPVVKTVCDRSGNCVEKVTVSKNMIREVRSIVEQYLPGLDDAKISVNHEHRECTGKNHVCPTAQLGADVKTKRIAGRTLVTFSKSVKSAKYTHQHYARATLSEDGKLVKLAISR